MLNVHIPQLAREDVLRWPYTRDRSVSVRSAFHRLRKREQTGTTTDHLRWAPIWNVVVWPKVKAFMWRLVSNAISIRANL